MSFMLGINNNMSNKEIIFRLLIFSVLLYLTAQAIDMLATSLEDE